MRTDQERDQLNTQLAHSVPECAVFFLAGADNKVSVAFRFFEFRLSSSVSCRLCPASLASKSSGRGFTTMTSFTAGEVISRDDGESSRLIWASEWTWDVSVVGVLARLPGGVTLLWGGCPPGNGSLGAFTSLAKPEVKSNLVWRVDAELLLGGFLLCCVPCVASSIHRSSDNGFAFFPEPVHNNGVRGDLSDDSSGVLSSCVSSNHR